MGDLFPALGVVVAALGGAAIGVERQWSGHATGTHPHLGGIRTFTLIGGAAGLAGVLATAGYGAVASRTLALRPLLFRNQLYRLSLSAGDRFGSGVSVGRLLGGLLSSTPVTFSFARLSRSEPTLSRALAIGALGASTVLFPRVLVATVVLNADVARTVTLLTAAAFVVGAVLFVWYLRHFPQ